MSFRNNLMYVDMKSPGASVAQFAPQAGWSDMGETEHFVQFYEDDTYLIDSMSGFVDSGLKKGNAAIIIATPEHRDALAAQLQARCPDFNALQAQGQYIALDAAEMLAKFMVQDFPDQDLFTQTVGQVVSHAGKGRPGVSAFGEMVALLWAQGNTAAAIRLEELWNDLGKTHSFALFCAYPMDGFRGTANGQPLTHICKTHSRVIPAESYAAKSTTDERLHAITLLQHKAASLEAEIAQRKRAEAAILEQRSRLAMAVAVAELGIWELDLETSAFTYSEQCKASFGFAPNDSLTYERLFEFTHSMDREAAQDALRTAIAAGTDYNIEYRIIDFSGRLRWIAVMGRCFHNGGYRMLGVTLDITERKRAAEILEQTVAERTAELQSVSAEREALSYNLHAPLRSMQGYADILMNEYSEKIDAQGRTYLGRIAAATGRMDRLIRDVLAYNRVPGNEPALEPVNLEKLISNVIDSYPHLQAPAARISVSGNLPAVLGNEGAVSQCLTNLLGNAVKFVGPDIQPWVRIWAEEVADARPDLALSASGNAPSFVRIFIQDNGIGIPEEMHKMIFIMFQRVSKNYVGTGIGLAIVKKAVESMGGKVGVISEPGKGSTFWLELQAAGSS